MSAMANENANNDEAQIVESNKAKGFLSLKKWIEPQHEDLREEICQVAMATSIICNYFECKDVVVNS